MANNELKDIAKELHEINRKLDRLCRASIFSIGAPTVITDELKVMLSESVIETSQEKHTL